VSRERAFLIRLDPHENGVGDLVADIGGAQRRIPKALAGDRVDIIRYEALSSRLEAIARLELLRTADAVEIPVLDRERDAVLGGGSLADFPDAAEVVAEWIAAGDIAVELRVALAFGETPPPPTVGTPLRDPALAWKAPLDRDGRPLTGDRAVAERFRQQLRDAVDQVPGAAILPSGVSNRVLTEQLRAFVGDKNGPPCEVSVRYRDGSTGPAFPLRGVCLADDVPEGWRTYHFAMLSIRHTEMDVEVDGAWLRNTDISRPRPAGDTDRIAFESSKTQFNRLCADGPVLVYLYQTGLDTAVVGFYRAVTERLMREPLSLAIVPMYFRRRPNGSSERTVAGYEQQGTFEQGELWAAQVQR
jgi:hypothetical protein